MLAQKERDRTKRGLVSRIYSNQRATSRERGHQPPTYTNKELRAWLFSQPLFHLLYDNWKRLDYQSGYKPSVDRRDPKLGYTMSNIQLMTWDENNKKGRSERQTVKVYQFNLEGGYLKMFKKMKEAAISVGGNSSCIQAVCCGKRPRAYGFIWSYKKDLSC